MPACRRCGIEFSPYPANRPGLECWRCEHKSREDEQAACLQAARDRIMARHRVIKVGRETQNPPDSAGCRLQVASCFLGKPIWLASVGEIFRAASFRVAGFRAARLQGWPTWLPGCRSAGSRAGWFFGCWLRAAGRRLWGVVVPPSQVGKMMFLRWLVAKKGVPVRAAMLLASF